MGEADAGAAAGRVLAALRGARRSEDTIGKYQVVLDRFAGFLAGRGLDSASDQVCVDFIASQTGIRLGSLHERVQDKRVQAVRRAAVLMAGALAGRDLVIDQSVIPARDGCPARFRPLRDDYVASCRARGNAEATVATKDKAASRFLAYLDETGAGLAGLGVRDVSGFLLRQRGLRGTTVAGLRSALADFLAFLAAAGRAPQGLAGLLPPHRHLRHESEPHLWTAEEIRRLLAVIDRQSAVGKRDYAMILLTARLGLRISDLRQLELGDLDWRAKTLKIVQRKTGRPLSLPLPATSAGRSSTTSGTAAPRPRARRCSSSTVIPSARSAAPRRSAPGCRTTRPAPGSSSRPARRAGCIPCAARWPWP